MKAYTIKELHARLEDKDIHIPYQTLYRWVRAGMVGKYNSSIGMLVPAQEVYDDLITIFKGKSHRNRLELNRARSKMNRLIKMLKDYDSLEEMITKRSNKDEELSRTISILKEARDHI